MALVRFFNFQLYFQDDKFKRVAGLFERQQLSISVSKIQSVQIKQNIIARLLNRYTLICPQVSSGGMAAGVAAHKNKQTLVMPVITKEQVQAVCGWLFPWFVDLTGLFSSQSLISKLLNLRISMRCFLKRLKLKSVRNYSILSGRTKPSNW